MLQTSVANPLIRLAFRLGLPDPGDALLETIGRRTGKPHLTPVCDGLEGETTIRRSAGGSSARGSRGAGSASARPRRSAPAP